MSLPILFKERLTEQFPSLDLDVFEKDYSTINIRVNTLKSSVEKIVDELQKQKITYVQNSTWLFIFTLIKTSTKQLTELEIYKNGHIYIQSFPSMLPPLILNPQKNEKILDIAAAPGSKTTEVAALMQNSGEIIANDISRDRIYKMKAILKTAGVTNVKITSAPAQGLWMKYPEYFDKTLVDVPCSMEGRIDVNDPKTYEDWSLKKIKKLSKLQKWILRSAISATKPGGTIVYSTCTLAPEENEEVIDWILEKEKAIEVEKIEILGINTVVGLSQWNGDRYDLQVKNTIRILPTSTMEGFFIAKLKKHESNVYKKNSYV